MRKGALLKASLPELSEYGRAHPTVAKVSPATVNKQLGAVQAIAGWGRHAGLVPEDVPWSDPFSEMRLEEDQSEREPFAARDLQTIFNAPLFTDHKLPTGAKGTLGFGCRCSRCSQARAKRNTRVSACPTFVKTRRLAFRSCGSRETPSQDEDL
jgi:hypothetical protein